MEMNVAPGWSEAILNLRGPCKLDIMRDGSTVTALEVPPGEVYRLILKREDEKPEDFVTGATT